MIMRIVLLVAFGLSCTVCLADTPESLFQSGVESFRKEDWQAAISSWVRVEQEGRCSGELYYNLANAYYRAGQIGKAIVYYERARKLLPRDRDVTQNLELARMATVDRIESPVRLFVWDWIDKVRDGLSLKELSMLVFGAGVLAAAVVALWIFGPFSWRAKARAASTAIIAVYALILVWYGWRSQLDSRPRAVVTEIKVDVFSAPDEAATQIFTLHEGTELRRRELVAGWIHVSLADGRSGWLPAETVEQI